MKKRSLWDYVLPRTILNHNLAQKIEYPIWGDHALVGGNFAFLPFDPQKILKRLRIEKFDPLFRKIDVKTRLINEKKQGVIFFCPSVIFFSVCDPAKRPRRALNLNALLSSFFCCCLGI